jgi:serine/threonine protein kinase
MGAGTRELEFLKVLGAGGFGEVYLANLHGRDRFVRRVAVKLLLQEHKSEELLRRHRDEARLLGLLHHDHIVQVLELTEIEGRPAVVMEYVQGVDLAEILEAGEKFTQCGAGGGACGGLGLGCGLVLQLAGGWAAASGDPPRYQACQCAPDRVRECEGAGFWDCARGF